MKGDVRRTCAFCGRVTNAQNMKRLRSSRRNPKVVMAASLSLAGLLDREHIDSSVMAISKDKSFFCLSHLIKAARYLCEVLVGSGKRISYCDDPCGKTIAYVCTADIPSHLVEDINAVSNSAYAITARDVWLFINEVLKKYHGTNWWPDTRKEEEGLEKAAYVQSCDEKGRLALLDPKVELETFIGEGVDMVKAEPYDDVASTMNDQGSTYEPFNSDTMNTYGAMEDLGKTETADLQKYFLVKGERLMKLFRFCPECGGQLVGTHLKAVGTAAVVRFVCGKCRVRTPLVKKWESKDDVVSQ